MALVPVTVSLPAVSTKASEVRVKDAVGTAFPDLTDYTAASVALTAAVVAAQAIGTGDASAEIDVIDTDVVTLQAAVAAFPLLTTSDVVLLYDPAVLTTRNQGRAALRALEARMAARGLA